MLMIGAVGLLGVALAAVYTPRGCEAMGGRWASVRSVCYSKLCYYTGDCGGPWASTFVACSDVKPGETEAMLHFYFGNAERKVENQVFWSTGKPDPMTIEAIFHNGRLAELKCPL